MIVAAFRGGTEPGLQAVWHFYLGLSPFGLLEAHFGGLPAFGLLEAVSCSISAAILGLDPRIGLSACATAGALTPALKTWRKKPSTGCEYS